MGRLRDDGHAILYISHKLHEICAIADRYVVCRDGTTVGSGLMAETSRDQLIRLMVGRPIDQGLPTRSPRAGPEALRFDGLWRKDESANITLTIRQGEILGIYGLVGAGRSEVMQALFGIGSPDGVGVLPDDSEVRIRTISGPLNLKVAYVPEDGQRQGAVLPLPIQKKVGLVRLHALSRHGFKSNSRARVTAQHWMETLTIRTSGASDSMEELSDGGQKQVALAKWLQTVPKVLILDEPTKGIDVGSKAAVYKIISELAQQGLAIILVSSDLPEVLGIADREAVMRRGRIKAFFERIDATSEALVLAATDG